MLHFCNNKGVTTVRQKIILEKLNERLKYCQISSFNHIFVELSRCTKIFTVIVNEVKQSQGLGLLHSASLHPP